MDRPLSTVGGLAVSLSTILVLGLLWEKVISSPLQAAENRPKRQIPNFGPNRGRIIRDYRKCCCEHGLPPECLHFCQFSFSNKRKEPSHCLLYKEIYSYTCWLARGDKLGPCHAGYTQPPPRPGFCPSDLNEENSLYCTQTSECHTDHSCIGEHKCCLSTCPTGSGNSGRYICRKPLVGNLSRCEVHRQHVLEQLVEADVKLNISSLHLWMPQCVHRTGDGPSYHHTQCIAASNVCFCVDPLLGTELLNTQHQFNNKAGRLNCSQLVSNISKCQQEELAILQQHYSLPNELLDELITNGSLWLPNCTADPSSSRSHKHLQCQTTSGNCWCTHEDGRAILDTVIKPGDPIFANDCTDYTPTACDEKVTDIVYRHRLELFGQERAHQVFEQRSFYENLPQLFVPRCQQNAQRSFEEEQLTWRVQYEFSEFFCVDPLSGVELEEARLGPGEHRFMPANRNRCPFRRSHCQTMVLSTLRKLQNKFKSFGPLVPFLVNRERALIEEVFVPACEHGSGDHYGYTARQCGASNATCWCVFRDGIAVHGTEHRNTTNIDCSPWWNICQLHDSPFTTSSAAAAQMISDECPIGEKCESTSQVVGTGMCTSLNSNDGWRQVLDPASCRLCWSSAGVQNDCVQLPSNSCSSVKPCQISNRGGRVTAIGDGMTAVINCSLCTCNYGQLKCLNSSCSQSLETTLMMRSCKASLHTELSPKPQCGPDGQTYPNTAAAVSCAGFNATTLQPGTCQETDVCHSIVCRVDGKCVPVRRRCLSPPCKQFSCVPLNASCSLHNAISNEVCSKDGMTFPSFCHLLAAGKEAAYRGACRSACIGEVCGADGITYTSHCHANYQNVAIDYNGRCKPDCRDVQCPLLVSCPVRTKLPSQCCDFCGAAALLSVNKALASALEEAGHVTPNDQRSIVSALSATMNEEVRQLCRTSAHLNVDGLIEVRVEAETLQAETSQAETQLCADAVAEIALRINSRSTSSTLSLSTVTAAVVVSNNAQSVPSSPSNAPRCSTPAQLAFTSVLSVIIASRL